MWFWHYEGKTSKIVGYSRQHESIYNDNQRILITLVLSEPNIEKILIGNICNEMAKYLLLLTK